MAERDVPNGVIKRLPILGGRLCIFWEASLGWDSAFDLAEFHIDW